MPIPTLLPTSLPISTVRVGTQCKDGTWSNSTGQGTCSSHGGIAK
ncbi:MAG: DUF3761 domain-containing protein [Chloroflexi bacterium]|nr:DUF3761 domain-containing protein [Chloroflexota bacterium]